VDKLRKRLSYAKIMATLALFLALTGGATAAAKFLVADAQIPAGDLAGSTYGAPVVANGTLTSEKFAASATAPNASKLGGLGADAFVHGAGAVQTALVARNQDDPNVPTQLAVAGLGTLTLSCDPNVGGVGRLQISTSGGTRFFSSFGQPGEGSEWLEVASEEEGVVWAQRGAGAWQIAAVFEKMPFPPVYCFTAVTVTSSSA